MKKIMFCGGGSAGHVIPNIALSEQLKGDYEICYTGTNSIEKDICRTSGIPFSEFEGVKLVRGKILCNLAIPFKLFKSIKQCREIMEREKPDLLFCKGGYVSVPAAVAARKLKIPVLTHESDISLGLANRVISPLCRRVLTSFPSTAKKISNGVFTGSPMRKNLFGRDKLSAKAALNLDLRPTILVFGGGSGSQKLNAYIRKIASKICKNYNILHICGKGKVLDTNIYGYKQLEFANDMGLIYACADYAVARCGSNSANELTALKIPTLFIPLENRSSRGDQVANAKYFEKRSLCRVLRERFLNENTLEENINLLISDGEIKAALAGYNGKSGNENIICEIKSALR